VWPPSKTTAGNTAILILQQIVKTSCAWECVTSLLTANKFEVVLFSLVLGVFCSSKGVAEENPRAIPTSREAKHAMKQHVATQNTRSRAWKTL